jgi:hypothetical protein
MYLLPIDRRAMDIVIKVYFTSLDIKSKAWKRIFTQNRWQRKGKKEPKQKRKEEYS